jgi:hypothetical protein
MLCLSEVPLALNRAGFSSLSYRQIYQAVLDGLLADHVERINGRWYTDAEAVPKIAKALGLSRSKAAA